MARKKTTKKKKRAAPKKKTAGTIIKAELSKKAHDWTSIVGDLLKDKAEWMVQWVHRRIDHIITEVKKRIVFGVLMVSGFLLLVLGIAKLPTLWGVSEVWGFLGLGAIILILGWVYGLGMKEIY